MDSWTSTAGDINLENAEIFDQDQGRPTIEVFRTDEDEQIGNETPIELNHWENENGEWESQWAGGAELGETVITDEAVAKERPLIDERIEGHLKWIPEHHPEGDVVIKAELEGDFDKNKLIKERIHEKIKTSTTKLRAETVIHKPSHIIVKQPPTQVLIHHPPLIVRPSPVVFHRHGKTIHRPVKHEYLPRKVEVRPVYHTVVKPIEKKVLIENKKLETPHFKEKIIVGKTPESGSDRTWIEHGEAYDVNKEIGVRADCGCPEAHIPEWKEHVSVK